MAGSFRSAVNIDDVHAAALRLQGIALRTPVAHNPDLDAAAGAELFFKCENLQRAGAFKIRGAFNRMSHLSDEERRRGVVAFSSGNHAQGVALAARILQTPAIIVMPADASPLKLAATREFGATVVPYDRKTQDRETIAMQIAAEQHAVLIQPYDDYRIMAGQGTVALELLEDVPDLDVLLVPLGGGGLLSGCAVAARHLRAATAVFGVEPAAGDDWARSWQAGERQRIDPPETIADGLRVTEPGSLTWPVVREFAAGVLTVSDDQIRAAMRMLVERLKLVVEPSGAVGLAAALSGMLPKKARRVGIVLSGGNIEIARLNRLLSDEVHVL